MALDKYVTLHKEWHTTKESLAGHGYIGIGHGTNISHFIQGTKSTELEAAVNVVSVQQEKYNKVFDATLSYLG